MLSGLGFVGALVLSCGDDDSDSYGGDGGSGAEHSSGGAAVHGGVGGVAGSGEQGGGGAQGGDVAGGSGGIDVGGTSAGGGSAGDAHAGQAGASSGGAGLGGASAGGAGSSGDAGADPQLGGAGSGGAAGGQPGGSRIVLAFPPPSSYTDAPHVTIRGTAVNPDGIASVSINGVNAETSDEFANWRLTVPTPVGRHRFSVSVADALGNVTPAAALEIVNHGTSLVSVRAMEFDSGSNSLFASDYWGGTLVRIDVATGVATTVAGPGRGGGEAFNGSQALALDHERQRALVQNWALDTLLGIDLETGDREVVSSGGDGVPPIQYTSALTVDAENGRAFAVGRNEAVAIDLATGDRTLITSAERGLGDAMTRIDDVVYDAVSGTAPRLLVSDPTAKAIFAIDVATGDRSLFSSVARGTGQGFSEPTQLELDATGRRLLVVDGSGDPTGHTSYRVNRAALVAVDLESGDRATLSDPLVGNGFLPETPYALAFDGTRAYLANDWGGQIAQVDLTSKQRKLLVSSDAGSGYRPYYPESVALLGSAGRVESLLMLEGLASAVVRVNLLTGARTLISGATRGAGPELGLARDIVVEQPEQGLPRRAFVMNARLPGILAVDLETGDRTAFSDANTGTGPELMPSNALSSSQGLALDPVRNQLLLSTSRYGSFTGSVTAVDLTTGNRTLVSSAQRGSGPDLDGLFEALVVDPDPPGGVGRAFVLGQGSIITLDLTSGERALFSTGYIPMQGLGPALPYANDLALDPLQQLLLVVGQSFLAGVRVDNGNRGTLAGRSSNSLVGLGPEFDRPNGVAFEPVRKVAYVSNPLRGALLAVDMTTGDRVIMAR